ncbi:MAG: TetR/AcrR family transcriptional regulator [Acidimicrobiales bacterium]
MLAAGRVVFARDGYGPASTSEIAARTGLTRGALYHHFPDKLGLFEAVLEQVARELVVRIDAAATSKGSARAGLQAGCEEWLDAMAEPELHRLYLVEGPAALGLARWRELDARYGGGSLRQGIEAVLVEIGDRTTAVEPLTALLTGALNEAALWTAESDEPTLARRAMRGSVRLLLDRLFARP